ncbi:sce7726 family protein [Aquitalea denitrificans]|uniref:sce7726 family protein n=1 Tax=Aquitalea denitrificans TaxID=519081 RepID=UPI00135C5E6A|nr:sce7726 family protein [Aquitalea denitrificans]
MLRDHEIRAELKARLSSIHASEPDTLIVDELGICQGLARADIAVVNGEISAFEIKSDADTLARLQTQIQYYSKICDRASIVVGHRHVDAAKMLIPSWWGLWIAKKQGDNIRLKQLRKGRINNQVEPYALAQLLWKEETFSLLEKYHAAKGIKSKPKKDLWVRLTKTIDLDTLKEEVRATLRARTDWR